MNLKTKVATAALAIGLCLGIAAPAHATAGNSVWNNSYGAVRVIRDSGSSLTLYSGWSASSIRSVAVDVGSCVNVGLHKYCAPYSTYYVTLGAGQYTVQRVS